MNARRGQVVGCGQGVWRGRKGRKKEKRKWKRKKERDEKMGEKKEVVYPVVEEKWFVEGKGLIDEVEWRKREKEEKEKENG